MGRRKLLRSGSQVAISAAGRENGLAGIATAFSGPFSVLVRLSLSEGEAIVKGVALMRSPITANGRPLEAAMPFVAMLGLQVNTKRHQGKNHTVGVEDRRRPAERPGQTAV